MRGRATNDTSPHRRQTHQSGRPAHSDCPGFELSNGVNTVQRTEQRRAEADAINALALLSQLIPSRSSSCRLILWPLLPTASPAHPSSTHSLALALAAMEAKPYPDFFQDPPRLGNQFVEDSYLQALLQRLLGPDVFAQVQPDLTRFGQSVHRAHTERKGGTELGSVGNVTRAWPATHTFLAAVRCV